MTPQGVNTLAQTHMAAWNMPLPKPEHLDVASLPQWFFSLPRPLAALLLRATHGGELLQLLAAMPPCASALDFCANALNLLGVKTQYPDFSALVPKEGPLVIVSNHPLGFLDGLALMHALLPHRPDLKALVNSMLSLFPALNRQFLPLDILNKDREARTRNMGILRRANAHLQSGGALACFPAGAVSHWQWGKGVVDPPWQAGAASLARRNGAAVLPLFIAGGNSGTFNMAGLIHPLLRTLMLPRELHKKRGETIRIRCEGLVNPDVFEPLQNSEALTAYLRRRCYALAPASPGHEGAPAPAPRCIAPVALPIPPQRMRQALAALPQEALLLREGGYSLYCVHGRQSSLLLAELGSLREYTFRLVGEGSGQSRDVDIFDYGYYHLLLWHENDARLAGAYRIGNTREILAEQGPQGLYTTTLFRMKKEFFQKYGNSLELGRAVVHPAYQREYFPLLLLWKGIGRFILREGNIRSLFGPVSLSLDYSPLAIAFAMHYLQTRHGCPKLAGMVRGGIVPKAADTESMAVWLRKEMTYNECNTVIKDIEGGRGLPILFKQYLKLGGKIGAFHRDIAFNTLDAFLCIDLAEMPGAMLERYMVH